MTPQTVSPPIASDPERAAAIAQLFAAWEELPDIEKFRRRQRAWPMDLTPRMLSSAAQGLVDTVMAGTIIVHKQGAQVTPVRPSTRAKLAVALAVWLAEMLTAACRGNYAQHTTRSEHFTGKPIGWQAFVDVKAALGHAGLIVAINGRWQQGRSFGKGNQDYTAPIFRPTPRLLELAEGHGVTLGDLGLDFGLAGLKAA